MLFTHLHACSNWLKLTQIMCAQSATAAAAAAATAAAELMAEEEHTHARAAAKQAKKQRQKVKKQQQQCESRASISTGNSCQLQQAAPTKTMAAAAATKPELEELSALADALDLSHNAKLRLGSDHQVVEKVCGHDATGSAVSDERPLMSGDGVERNILSALLCCPLTKVLSPLTACSCLMLSAWLHESAFDGAPPVVRAVLCNFNTTSHALTAVLRDTTALPLDRTPAHHEFLRSFIGRAA